MYPIPRPPKRALCTASHLVVLVALAACESYEPRPLDFEALLASIHKEDTLDPSQARNGSATLSFETAFRDLLVRSPSLVEARSAVARLVALRNAGVSLAGPTLMAGPLDFSGPGVTGSLRRGIEAMLGISLPIFGRLGAAGDVDEAEVTAAIVALEASVLDAVHELRRLWIEGVLALREVAVQDAALRLAESIRERSALLLGGGQASGLDLRMADVDVADARAGRVRAQQAATRLRGQLARHLGRSFATTLIDASAELPPIVVDDSAEASPIDVSDVSSEHPNLRELAARYEVAEKKLRLEVRKQYPDLALGPTFAREGKTNRSAFLLGIDLPFLDGNRRGIDEAKAVREAMRTRYETQLRSLRTQLDADRERRRLARLDYAAAKRQVAASGELRDLARRSLDAGTIDTWRYLEIERRYQAVTRNELAALRSMYEAELAIERSSARFHLAFKTRDNPNETEEPNEPNLDTAGKQR